MIPAEIREAAQLSDALYLAQQALHLTASTRRDIVWTVADGRRRIALNQPLAEVAAVMQAQGRALRVSFSRGGELLTKIQEGMSLLGFPAEAVQAAYDFVLQACAAIEATPDDGSGLESLLATLEQTIAAPPLLY